MPFVVAPDLGQPMLSQQQADLIRFSAERLGDANVAATNAFYTRLFKEAPGVRSLFPDDMFDQSAKLWNTIVMVVHSADDLSAIEAELLALGARHVGYGAEPAHYVVVTDVLIKTISSLMRDQWSPDTQHAWKDTLETVCAVMIRGATDHAS